MKYERPLRRPSGTAKACPPKPPPHNRKPRGTAGARKPYRPTLRRTSGTAKACPPKPPPHNRKQRGTAGARKPYRATLAAPVGNSKDMLPEAPAAQPQTARHGGSAKVRSAHPAAPVANVEGVPSASPAAQPQPPWHGGSVAGSRGAHADGGTRHRASSRRLHRAISPWRGAGSRGATVGRPSAHCASPGRHSGPRPSPPDCAPPRAHLPQPRARAA